MKKQLLLISLLTFLSIQTYAQGGSSFGDRLVFGGNFGLQFGDVTIVEISPNVGYLLEDWWLAGVGAKYIYIKYNYDNFNYKSNVYGGSVFNQFYILQSLIAHAELEVLNLDTYNDILDEVGDRTTITNFYVGGGARLPAGGNSFFSILVLWNLNETRYSPYSNPLIRIGLGIGF